MPNTALQGWDQAANISETSCMPSLEQQRPHSPGQPLDSATRAFMELRFGHDFSKVRVHTDERAVESAEAINARAYTVGQDVVFAEREYAPETTEGKRLLAHELTHVIQQGVGLAHGHQPQQGMPLAPRGVLSTQLGAAVPRVQRQSKGKQAQKQEAADLRFLPDFNQRYQDCGAAAIVSSLLIWDREKQDKAAPNKLVVMACDLILRHLTQHRDSIIKTLKEKGLEGQKQYEDISGLIKDVRDVASQPGAKPITEEQYQDIGLALYVLYSDGKNAGVSASAISAIRALFGFDKGPTPTHILKSFDEIFTDTTVTNLKPGQIAEVTWYAQEGKALILHAFLIGRLSNGKWFLHDQGAKPVTRIVASDLNSLLKAARKEQSHIYTGAVSTFLLGAPTEVRLLGERSDVERKASSRVP